MIPLFLWSVMSAQAADPFILVLGVAQDAGHPQAGCDKSCCKPAWDDPVLRHHPSSVAIVDPETDQRWILDASPDLPEQLAHLGKVSPGALTGVFVTHAHIGHYTGLMHLGREVMGASKMPVYAMPRMQTFLGAHEPWKSLTTNGNIAIQPLADGVEIELNDRLTLTPVQVPHRDELSETVGFLVRGPNKAVLYLPDIDKWDKWSTAVESWVGQVDIAMLDGTFYADGEVDRDMAEIPHPFISESMARFEKLPAEQKARVRFTHLNHTNPALDPNSEASKAIEAAGLKVAVEGDRYPL